MTVNNKEPWIIVVLQILASLSIVAAAFILLASIGASDAFNGAVLGLGLAFQGFILLAMATGLKLLFKISNK